MSDYQPAPEGKDPVLWDIAHDRADFKEHLVTYLIINAFFWAIWFFSLSTDKAKIDLDAPGNLPWPVWPMLSWSIALAFHYVSAYVSPGGISVDTEYEKLKKQLSK